MLRQIQQRVKLATLQHLVASLKGDRQMMVSSASITDRGSLVNVAASHRADVSDQHPQP